MAYAYWMILGKRKQADMTEVVRPIQVLGLKQEKLLGADKVKVAFIDLLATN